MSGRPPGWSNGPSVRAGSLCERQEWILLNGMFHTASMVIERRGSKWLPHAGAPPRQSTAAVEKGVRADVLGGNEQAAYLQSIVLTSYCNTIFPFSGFYLIVKKPLSESTNVGHTQH